MLQDNLLKSIGLISKDFQITIQMSRIIFTINVAVDNNKKYLPKGNSQPIFLLWKKN